MIRRQINNERQAKLHTFETLERHVANATVTQLIIDPNVYRTNIPTEEMFVDFRRRSRDYLPKVIANINIEEKVKVYPL